MKKEKEDDDPKTERPWKTMKDTLWLPVVKKMIFSKKKRSHFFFFFLTKCVRIKKKDDATFDENRSGVGKNWWRDGDERSPSRLSLWRKVDTAVMRELSSRRSWRQRNPRDAFLPHHFNKKALKKNIMLFKIKGLRRWFTQFWMTSRNESSSCAKTQVAAGVVCKDVSVLLESWERQQET